MNYLTLKMRLIFGLIFSFMFSGLGMLHAQVTLTASGGTGTGTFLTVNDAFAAINAGTHQGSVVISINGNTTEPAVAVPLLASGQGTASYSSILIKPTVVSVISATPIATNGAVLVLDGADNVTIDGSITVGGTTRDLTIQNLAANTLTYQYVVRLIGRTTLGLGCVNDVIKNTNIIGSTAGNSGYSGSTVTTTYGIFCAGSTATSTYTSSGFNYDTLLIENNFINNCHVAITVNGSASPNQCDNNLITKNVIGSTTLANSVALRGIYVSQHTNSVISENVISNISVNTSNTVAGIDLAGTASSGCTITRNHISEVASITTSGYGAYGINIQGGSAHVVSNNVIHSIYTTNYSSTSTTFNAFGIRISAGTGIGVYYNSVNIAGNYTTAPTAGAASAAFCVTSTAATFTANNNIFNNITSTVTTGVKAFPSIWLPASYNFLNGNLDNNFYGGTNDADHFVGKIGVTNGTGLYANLGAWKTISQVNNPTNDFSSFPATTAPAPYTSATDLVIPSGTVTPCESGGIAIPALGLPNIDFLGINRPAGSGTLPDIGAYEFSGVLGDFFAPVVVSVSATPTAEQCSPVVHVVTANITDSVGVFSATLAYTYSGVAQTAIPMTLTSGTAQNGTWTGTIPAAATTNVPVTFSVTAADTINNISSAVNGPSYNDGTLTLTAGTDQTITLGSNAILTAVSNNPNETPVFISEVILFKTGTGQGTYPAYIGTGDNDFIELTNFGTTSADISGWQIQLVGATNGTFTIPAGAIIPAGQTAFFGVGSVDASSPTNLFYAMGLTTFSSTSALGVILKKPSGQIQDAFAANSYTFLPASGVTTALWSGNTPSGSGACGYIRTALVDNNLASDWVVTSASALSTPAAQNVAFTPITPAASYVWTPGGATTASITVSPAPVGTYSYAVSYSNGICTVSDTVVVTVVAPITPVADFSGAPLSIAAGANVTFTDLSANLPSSWSWVITPSAGVVYTSGTSSTSQNPVVTFNNAGNYTVQLTASNSAGTDDSIKVNYVIVSACGATVSNTADTDIGNVTFAGINQGTATPVLSNPAATGTYSNFNAGPQASVEKGGFYPISLSQITSGATFYSAWFNVFIDWNGDGVFDPITERAFTSAAATSGTTPTQTGTIAVPSNAVVGPRYMRVILDEGGSATSGPCTSFSYGEIEDYIVNVVCPTTFIAPAAPAVSVCTGSTATLSATSSYSGSIVNWYANATGGSPLATGLSFTSPVLTANTTYYVSDSIHGCGVSLRTPVSVTVNQPSSAVQTVVNCGTYVWPFNGVSYTASGSYVDTIPNALGCDSIVTLNLTINQATSATQTVVNCGAYVWPFNGASYTTSGTYVDTIPNAVGCDSIVTLNLTINQATAATQTVTSCGAYTWSFNGVNYPSSGTYIDTIPNAAGCDSVVTLVLTVNQASASTETVTSCGDYTDNAGMTYTTSGTYIDTLVAANGCDSIVTLNLTIINLDLTVTATSPTLTSNEVGAGASYQWIDCGNGNTPIAGETNASFTATANGSYAVIVTKNNCSDTSACQVVGNIGIDELADVIDAIILPNPAVDFFRVQFDAATQVEMEILDAQGKVVRMKSTIQSNDKIDIRSLEHGVYFVRLTSAEGNRLERIVKN